MEGKKKYFALVLFLFLGLMIFTFANPAEEEKEFQNSDKDQSETVSDRREETNDEENTNEQEGQQNVLNVVTDNNQVNNQQNVVDNSLRDALAAVEKAEGTYTQEDLDAAKDLVNNVTDTTEKGNLEERLEEVEAGIAVLALLEDLEKQVEEAKEKTHMTDATAYRDDNEIANKIEALNNETVKETLAKRLTTVSKLLDDNAAPVASVEAKAYNDHVEITAEDEAGNPFKLFLSKDNGTEEEITSGEKTTSEGVYTLRLVDDAFNEETIKFVVDKSMPKLKDLTNGGHYKDITLNVEDKTKVTIKVTNMDTKEEKEVSDGTKLTDDATYMIELTDEAGNVNYYYLAIDSVKPNISTNNGSYINYTKWLEVTDKFLTNVTITRVDPKGNVTTEEFTRADFTVGERNENFKLRYKLDKENEGKYTITAGDKYGNTKTETVTMDKTAPVIDEGKDYTLEAGIDTVPELKAKAVDEIQGTWTIEPAYINRHNADGTIDRNISAIDVNVVGKYNVVFQATDKAGNTSEKKSKMIYVVDTTAPTIHLAGTVGLNKNEYHVESGTKVTLDDIMAKVTDNYDSETTIKPYKANLYISNVASENKYNITDFTNGLDTAYVGRYNIYYEYTDTNGNKATATMLLVMTDTTKPEIILPGTIGLNKNEYHVESGTKVSYEDLIATVKDVTAAKTVAPKKADLYISNVASENKYNITDFTNGLDTAYVGRYNIEYTVTDKGGNTTTKTMLLVMKDTVKPTLTANITEGRTYITGEDITNLQFTIYKDGVEQDSFNSKTFAGGKYFSINATTWFGEGEYTITATDEGRNTTTLETYVYKDEISLTKYKDSVTLSKDANLEEIMAYTAGRDIVIDLNNHNLTIKNLDNNAKRTIETTGKLTIKNGNIINQNPNGMIKITETGELVLDNVKLTDSTNNKAKDAILNYGKTTITDSEITITAQNGTGPVAVNSHGELVIKNTKITNNSTGAYAVNVYDGTALIEDVTITANKGGFGLIGGNTTINNSLVKITNKHYPIYVAPQKATRVTVNGGKFTGNKGAAIYATTTELSSDLLITINSGEFTSEKSGALLEGALEKNNLVIKGGTFKSDVSKYVAEGYRQNDKGTVVESSKIDSVSYLKEIAAIGGTYILESDLTVSDEIIVIPAGVNLTINTNGKTITGTYTEAKATSIFNVATGASLKLTGNGTITYTAEKPDAVNYSYSSSTIVNKGNLEIDGPTVINTTAKGAPYVIDNGPGADFTLTSGTIKQTGPNRAIRLYSYDGGPAVNAKLNGGTVTGSMAVYIHLISSTQSKAPEVNLTVNGGTYSSTDANGFAFYSYSNGNSMENIDVTFNGGAFNGYVAFGGGTNKTHKEKVTVNGGTFSHGIGRYVDTTEDPSGWIYIVNPPQE